MLICYIFAVMLCAEVIINKAIVDYTAPALCTLTTPFPADPMFSECGSDRMIRSAARRY